jgi:hypothetical protein
MIDSNSALRAHLGNCLRQLEGSLEGLAEHIRAHTNDVWFWQRPGPGVDAFTAPQAEYSRDRALEGVTDAILAIKYEHELQDPHESRIAPGMIALTQAGIDLAHEVNGWKLALANVLRAMADRTEIGVVDPRTGERGERPLREVALEAFFYRRLHPWQATRRLQILRESPEHVGVLDYVGFMWATSREVRRTSREELLGPTEVSGIHLSEQERETVTNLPVGEPLAFLRPGHTTPKANIRWVARGQEAPVTCVRIAVLPLIMLGNRLPTRLRKLPPAPTPPSFRLSRGDTELEPHPLLESVHVHRYVEHLRQQKRGLLRTTKQSVNGRAE